VTGAGTQNYLARWTPDGSTLGTGVTWDDGTNVGIGTDSPANLLHVEGAGAGLMQVKSTTAGSGAFTQWYNSDNSVRGIIGLDGTGYSGTADQFSISTWTAHPIKFFTDQTERMVIGSNGNVGIGTLSPSTRFHTTGGVRHEDLTGSGTRFVVADDNGNLSATQSTALGIVTGAGTENYLARWTPDGNTLGTGVTWDDGTNVGIGTAAPLQKLDIGVNGGIGFSGSTPFLNSDDKKLYSPDDGILEWMTHDNAGAHGFAVSHQGDRRVYLNTAGHSYLTGGNLGIGHTAPGHRLSVGAATGDGQAVTIRGYSDIGGWKGGAAFGYTTSTVIMGELGGVATIGGHDATLDAWADLAINSGGGNVGVGTSSPQILIDTRVNSIIGTSATTEGQHAVANQGIKVNFGTTSGGEFAGMRLVVDPGTNACGNTGDIRFDTWECNTSVSREVMRISGRGRVGIGTPSPATKLDVSGSTRVTQTTYTRALAVTDYTSITLNNGNSEWTDVNCAGGWVVTGVQVYVGSYLQGPVRVICANVSDAVNWNFSTYRVGNSWNGLDHADHIFDCDANEVARGFGLFKSSTGEFDNGNVLCSPLYAGYTRGAAFETLSGSGNNTGPDNQNQGGWCPPGSYLVGSTIYATGRLDSNIRLRCATISKD